MLRTIYNDLIVQTDPRLQTSSSMHYCYLFKTWCLHYPQFQVTEWQH